MSVVSCQLSVVGGSEERGARSEKYAPSAFPLSALTPRRSLLAPPRGISLTEVLIAMGILTLGLLGVAALFPVGGYYMQKAEISDRGSAIAQNVMSDIVARGMLNPKAWWMWEKGTISGVRTPTNPPSKFSRNLAQTMRQQFTSIATDSVYSTWPPAVKQQATAIEFGSAYIIDPIGAASTSIPNTANGFAEKGGIFPGNAYWITSANYSAPQWQPWVAASAAKSWPMHRLTLLQAPETQMSSAVANRFFSSTDDLTVDFPDRADQPAMQTWRIANTDLNGDGVNNDAVSRQFQGDYSWIVSVAPSSAAARDALASNPENYPYEVSVVVFYKRVVAKTDPLTTTDMATNLDLLARSERMVKASVVSTGLTGGEVLLTRHPLDTGTGAGQVAESPFDQLKVGQWVMLCGPHPSSTDTAPTFVMHWYQVVSIEGKNERLNDKGQTSPAPPTSDPERRLVSLRGPEWPWQPNATASNLSNNLCVGIFPGAVAVHAKTMRLEGQFGSAFSAGWSAATASGNSNTQNDWVGY